MEGTGKVMEKIYTVLTTIQIVCCSTQECTNSKFWLLTRCTSVEPDLKCFSNNKQELQFKGSNEVRLMCHGKVPHNESIACSNLTGGFNHLRIIQCSLNDFKMKPFLAGRAPKTISLEGDSAHILPLNIIFFNLAQLTRINIERTRTGGRFNISFEALGKLNVLYINDNDFARFPPKPFIRLQSLRSLTLKRGRITYLPDDLLQNLRHLEILDLRMNTIRYIDPKAFNDLGQLSNLNLSNNLLRALHPILFTANTNLRILDVSSNLLGWLPLDLFRNIPSIIFLSIEDNRNIRMIPNGFFIGAGVLGIFRASYCKLHNLDAKMFKKTLTEADHNSFSTIRQSEDVRLQDSQIKNNSTSGLNRTQIRPFTTVRNHKLWQRGFKSLKTLNLSHNLITAIEPGAFRPLTGLVELDLSYNGIAVLPDVIPFGTSGDLEKVIVSHCTLNTFPKIDFTSHNLQILDFSYNRITDVILPVYTKNNFTLILSHNIIRNIRLTFPKNGKNFPSYCIDDNWLHCDCNLEVFLHFLHSNIQRSHQVFKKVQQVPCDYQNGTRKLNEILPSQLNCTLKNCPTECKCFKELENEAGYVGVVVNCSHRGLVSPPTSIPADTTTLLLQNNNLSALVGTEFESWVTLNALYLSNNSLLTLGNMTIPHSLHILSINNNRLYELPSLLMEKINSTVGFELSLSGNRWACNCKLASVIAWIKENKQHIRDFESMQCTVFKNGTSLLERIEDFEIDCDELEPSLPALSPILSSMAILILVTTALFTIGYIHRNLILAYLYPHNLYKPKQFNSDARFDAFVICHAHDIEGAKEIFESLPCQYLIRIHGEKYAVRGRHQRLGHGIKISRSVVLLITERFVRSTLFQIHFWKAYQKTHQNFNGRIIPIFIDTLDIGFLSRGLRTVISSEYRLVLQERFFREKLTFFLGPPLKKRSEQLNEDVINKKPYTPRRKARPTETTPLHKRTHRRHFKEHPPI